jgi:hypothetical protein
LFGVSKTETNGSIYRNTGYYLPQQRVRIEYRLRFYKRSRIPSDRVQSTVLRVDTTCLWFPKPQQMVLFTATKGIIYRNKG